MEERQSRHISLWGLQPVPSGGPVTTPPLDDLQFRPGWATGMLTESSSDPQAWGSWKEHLSGSQDMGEGSSLCHVASSFCRILSKPFYFPMPSFSPTWAEEIKLDKYFSNRTPCIPKTHYKSVSRLLHTGKWCLLNCEGWDFQRPARCSYLFDIFPLRVRFSLEKGVHLKYENC